MLIKISEEVKKALAEHKPVVALESTIISHGMPYPTNVETALKVEQTIRETGAVPATIGIIEGVPVVGMSEEEILDKYYAALKTKTEAEQELSSLNREKQNLNETLEDYEASLKKENSLYSSKSSTPDASKALCNSSSALSPY